MLNKAHRLHTAMVGSLEQCYRNAIFTDSLNKKKYESICIFLLNTDTFLSCRPTILVLHEIRRNPSLLMNCTRCQLQVTASNLETFGENNGTRSSDLTPPEFKYFHQSNISASWNAPITWILVANRNSAKVISLAPYLDCPTPYQFPRFRKQEW
jgi:hypothetical protein